MKFFKIPIILFLFVIAITPQDGYAQNSKNSVNVNILLSPPYSPRLFDYLIYENKPILTLTNNTARTQEVMLEGSLEGDNGISLVTKRSYRPSNPIYLGPYEVKSLTATDKNLDFIDENNISINASQKVKNGIMKDGILPEGNYTLCIQAKNFNTGENLSPEPPSGCTMLSISYLQPPSIITPYDEGEVNTELPQFSWTPVVGNTGGKQVYYDLYILKLQENQNPYDAMQQAVNYNVGNPLKKTNLTSTNYSYSPSDWELEDSANYAIQVIADDPDEQLYFVNKGESEITTFQYLPPEQTTQEPEEEEEEAISVTGPVDFNCDCMVSLPSGSAQTGFTVSIGDQFQIGNYTLTVTSVAAQPDSDGKFSGEGTIPFPLGGGTAIPVKVTFTNLQVNGSDEALAGFASAEIRQDASFIPETGPDETIMNFSQNQADVLSSYFVAHTGQLVSNATGGEGASLELPLGIDRMINGQEQVIAITGMYFTPEKASVDAAYALEMPDANPSAVAFGQKFVCLNNNGLCNTPTALFLPDDIPLQFITGEASLTLLGAAEQINNPSDSGTYVTFNQEGFQNIRIQGEYLFPLGHIVKIDDTEINAKLTANAVSWSDWMGEISIEEEFKIVGIPDFTFMSANGIYDHSDLRNPEDLPASYTESDENASLSSWHGIYCSQAEVNLPGVIKKLNAADPITSTAEALIFDDLGASFYIYDNDIMDLSDGDLDGWAYSINAFDMEVFRNAIVNGSFAGKLLLPVAPSTDNDSSRLGYNCLLSMENDEFNYQFTVDSTQSASLPMWKAKMSLEATSSIQVTHSNEKFSATADLNGSMDIKGNLGQLKKLDLQNMEFENLSLSSGSGTLSVGTFSAGEDGDKKLGGFPLTISSVKPDSLLGPGLEVNTTFTLCDISFIPNAETAFTIYGEPEINGGRTHYVFGDGILDSIQVEGDLSVVNIKGMITFFHEDPTFGDGLKGTVEAEFPNIAKIKATVQFGEMTDPESYKYWYVDAMADLSTGFPLIPPYLYGYGFGGGAYYRMERVLPADFDSTITDTDAANFSNPGEAPSGAQYIPNNDKLFGFKAMLLFGLQERKTFNSDVTMEMTLNSNGGFSDFYLYGEARVLSKKAEGEDKKKAMVKGGIDVHYDHEEGIFHALMDCKLNIKEDVFEADLNSTFHFEKSGWYIYMGRPYEGQYTEVKIFNKFNIYSYFEAGNMCIDPIPDIDQGVLDILNNSGVDYSFFGSRNETVISSGKGMICGAKLDFDYSGSWLIFKASLDAAAGYDLSIKKYTTDCEGNETIDPIGVNGWYAFGQMYAGMEALVSVHVDLTFVEKDFKILEAGAGAVLTGGVPDPTWVKGAIGGYFSILNGSIEGDFNYKFSYGQECIPNQSDVLEDMEVVAEILPADEASDVEIDILPAVATNLKITSNEFTLDQVDHETSEVTQRVFRFSDDNLSFDLRNTSNNQILNCASLLSSDEFGFFIKPQTVLQPETEFELTVTATVDEFINGQWQAAEKEDGTTFEEVHTLTFTTNEGLQGLNEESVKHTMPYAKQRNFCYTNIAQGGIFTTQNIDFESFDLPGTDEGYDQEFVARFVPVGSAEGSGMDVPVRDENGSFEFDGWPNLQPETIYCIQFIGRWTAQQQESDYPGVMELRQVKMFDFEGTKVTQSQREINMDKLNLADNEKKLYSLFFRTSKFQDYQDKLQSMNINEWVLTTEYVEDYIDNPNIGNYLYLEASDMDDPNTMLAKVREQLHLGADEPISMLAPYQTCLIGEEPFDDYDIHGYSKTYQEADIEYTYEEPPLLSIEAFDVNQWARELFSDMVDLLVASGEVREFKLPGYSGELGGYVAHPPELEAPTASPLSESEIYDGTQLIYYQGAYSSTCDHTRLNNPIPQEPAGDEGSGMTYSLSNTYLPVQTIDSQTNLGVDASVDQVEAEAAYGLEGMSQDIVSQMSEDKNVMNITYRFNYEPGSGFNETPNSFINKAIGYTDPSPEAFGSFYSSVGQAYDMAQSELGTLGNTNMNVSATFNGPVSSSANQGQVNVNLGNMNIGNY